VASCAELYNNTRYTVVRFGNVLGSRGSVVRIFLDQIRKGGPVTVTDPRMTRFFMTIPEAVSLVLASGSLGNGFGVYVLEMGKPYRIVELAEKMIRLCGLEPGTDIKIEFSGVRPGEKLEEVLVTGEEKLEATSNAQIRRLAGNLAGPRWNVPDLKTKLGTEDAKLREWLLENAY
jgi:FlaA1/EpsC-like NDP-sugar epimerase